MATYLPISWVMGYSASGLMICRGYLTATVAFMGYLAISPYGTGCSHRKSWSGMPLLSCNMGTADWWATMFLPDILL